MLGVVAVVTTIYVLVVFGVTVLVVFGIVTRDVDGTFAVAFMSLCLIILAVRELRRVERKALKAVGAKIVTEQHEPELHAIVARVAAAAGVPTPQVAVARSWAPNALAVGYTPKRAAIAVTTELLRRLEPHELEAVVAHEVAHVANRDGAVMTYAGGPALVGAAMWNSDDERGKLLFLVYYWPLHVLGLLLMWTLSRYREYAADRGSALYTGAPQNLMSALTKVAGRPARGDLRGGAAVSALCIVPAARRFELFSDHPPLEKRLRKLAEMTRTIAKGA